MAAGRTLCWAGPSGQWPHALRSPLAFLSLLPWHLHHVFCLATCPPLTPLSPAPVLWSSLSPPPQPPGFFWRARVCSGRRRRRLSQWPEPCPGSSWGSGAEACGTPETGQCGGSAAAGTLGGLPFAGGRPRCPHEPVAWLGPVGAWGLEGGVRLSTLPSGHPSEHGPRGLGCWEWALSWGLVGARVGPGARPAVGLSSASSALRGAGPGVTPARPRWAGPGAFVGARAE